MKKFNFLALCLFLSVGFIQAQTYQNTTATTPVDGVTRAGSCGANTQPGVNMSSITVPITGTIADPSKITFNLDISAAWLGDVAVELVTPSGNAITLIRRIGASGFTSCGDSSSFVAGNILGFNSANTSPIDHLAVGVGVAIPSGNYAPSYGTASFPQHHPGVMSTFLTGKTLNGEWKVLIYDYGYTDATTLNSWQIVVAAGATLKTTDVGTFGSEISLQQNPVKDFLELDINKNNSDFESLEIEVYDVSGKLVIKELVDKSVENIKIEATQLTSGIYFLVPKTDGERKQSIKFIKN